MNWSSMETHPTAQQNGGQIGCRARSSTSSKNIPGQPKAEEQTSLRSSSHWAPRKTIATWKRGKPAFWEQLKIRFQLALKQPPQQAKGPTMGFMQALQDAPKHWVGPPTWGQFLDTCHHWHKYRDAYDESHLQYKDWLQQGQRKG